jgi:hypothetical protein
VRRIGYEGCTVVAWLHQGLIVVVQGSKEGPGRRKVMAVRAGRDGICSSCRQAVRCLFHFFSKPYKAYLLKAKRMTIGFAV